MIQPPGIDHGVFVVSPETVWYARVLLLFSASAQTDTGSKSFDCALVSTMETYDDPENGCNMMRVCIIRIIRIIRVTCIELIICLYVLYVSYVLCILYLLFCFGRMVEVDWVPDYIRA